MKAELERIWRDMPLAFALHVAWWSEHASGKQWVLRGNLFAHKGKLLSPKVKKKKLTVISS